MAKVGEVLRFKDGGPSVEDARKAMFAAKEAPNGMVAKNVTTTAVATPAAPVVTHTVPAAVVVPGVADVLEPEFEEELEVPVAAKPAVEPLAAPVVPPVVVTAKIERVETDQFVGEIKQDGGKWVAELRYKTGGGTERFIADTKNSLMLKLLEGKGHATLRVNKAVRREKFGWSELDRQYPLPSHITAKDFEEMSEKSQDALLWTIASQQTIAFADSHPEFYKDPENKNSQKMSDFLGEHKLPITKRNLEYAFEELMEANQLVVREEKPVAGMPVSTTLPVSTTAPARVDSVPAAASPAAVPTAPIATAAPAVVVRKRGTTGLQPGQSSSETELNRPEAGGEQRQLSEAELRKLPLSDLKRIADKDRRAASAQR